MALPYYKSNVADNSILPNSGFYGYDGFSSGFLFRESGYL